MKEGISPAESMGKGITSRRRYSVVRKYKNGRYSWVTLSSMVDGTGEKGCRKSAQKVGLHSEDSVMEGMERCTGMRVF